MPLMRPFLAIVEATQVQRYTDADSSGAIRVLPSNGPSRRPIRREVSPRGRAQIEANPDNPIAKQRISELEPTPPR
jgi:hypothetical protein